MWSIKTFLGTAIAFYLVLPVVSFWEKSRPIISEVEVTPVFLDNSTYRLSLLGTVRDGCLIKTGSARLVLPHSTMGRNLGQWEFDLKPGDQVVTLKLDLTCSKEKHVSETLGPFPIIGTRTGKGN